MDGTARPMSGKSERLGVRGFARVLPLSLYKQPTARNSRSSHAESRSLKIRRAIARLFIHWGLRFFLSTTEAHHGNILAGRALCAAFDDEEIRFYGSSRADTRVRYRREHGDLQSDIWHSA